MPRTYRPHKRKNTRRKRRITPRNRRGGAVDLQKAYPNTGTVPNSSTVHSLYYHSGGGDNPALLGDPWGAEIKDWPGVDGIPANRNHFSLNRYQGGRKKKRRTYRGGGVSNFLAQDLVNLGRQAQYGIGSAYNILAGYPETPNPLPWKDQLEMSK